MDVVYFSNMIRRFSFPEIYPVSGLFSGYFPDIFRIFIKSSEFFTEWMVYFSHMIWWVSFQEIYPVFRFFPDFRIFQQFLSFLHRMDGFLLPYDMMIFFSGNISSLRIFFRIFFQIFIIFLSYFQIYSFIIVYSAHKVGL